MSLSHEQLNKLQVTVMHLLEYFCVYQQNSLNGYLYVLKGRACLTKSTIKGKWMIIKHNKGKKVIIKCML